MASDYRITGNGTTIYLINSSGQPTSGGAATAAATTPWAIRYGDWQPRAAPPNTLFAGGLPIAQSYDVVEETIPLVLVGGTADTLVARLQQLRQVVSSWIAATPAQLYAQPAGMTSPVYFEIYKASVQERAPASSEGPGEGASTAWVDLTITRSAFGGRLSSGETLLSAASYKNTGTGSPDNVEAYSAGAGDLIAEGSPLNVTCTMAAGANARLYLATVSERIYSNSLAGSYSTTTITSPGDNFFTPSVAPADRWPLRGRVLLRVNAISANAQVQLTVKVSASAGAVYTSAWITPPVAGATLIDMGGFALDAFRATNLTTTIGVRILLRSTDGASASMTFSYVELLMAYTFGRIDTGLAFGGSALAVAETFQARSGLACLPVPQRAAVSSGGALYDVSRVAGTLPRYYSGASLYAAWLTNTLTHSTTDTATITATHAPLYRTLRGNG